MQVTTLSFELHFGGPDQTPGHLRDVLEERIENVPAGGNIDWVTYYFRDRRLAAALLRAHERGVHITVTLAGKPRTADANDAVIAMLSGTGGLGDGLRLVSLPGIPAPPGRAWKPQLHEKLYCFSHPQPVAFIGSFNPSGDVPEARPDIVQEIGDHERGYNALIGITQPILVAGLMDHARQLNSKAPGLLYRFNNIANKELAAGDTTIYFWPRVRRHPVIRLLQQLNTGSRVRIVASHIRATSAVNLIIDLARRGVTVEILVESTLRRVPIKVERRLQQAGIRFSRINHPDGLPMHLKFVLVQAGNRHWSIFGSFNWTYPSFWLNHEIAAISSDPDLYMAFDECWNLLASQSD